MLGSDMSAERVLGYKAPVHWALWCVSLLASVVVGWYAGRAFISASLWMQTGRACPEGWVGVGIGLTLFTSGILVRKSWRGYAAGFLCGTGSGFVVWPAFLIWWSKVAPSC